MRTSEALVTLQYLSGWTGLRISTSKVDLEDNVGAIPQLEQLCLASRRNRDFLSKFVSDSAQENRPVRHKEATRRMPRRCGRLSANDRLGRAVLTVIRSHSSSQNSCCYHAPL
jgi:hypothetical protein